MAALYTTYNGDQYEFTLADAYDDFIMETNANPCCDFCTSEIVDCFYLQELKILCASCVNHENISIQITIHNQPDCILFSMCQNKAKWGCIKTNYKFCESCHNRNCVDLDPNSTCIPKALFNSADDLCAECGRIPSEFMDADGLRICERCLINKGNIAAFRRIVSDTIGELKMIYIELFNDVNSIIIQEEKYQKYLIGVTLAMQARAAVQPNLKLKDILDEGDRQNAINREKQETLVKIADFLKREAFIMNLIENNKVELQKLKEFFTEIRNNILNLKITFRIRLFNLDEETELNSQNDKYFEEIKESLNSTNDNRHALVNRDSDQKEFFPNGEILPYNESDPVETEMVYIIDALWMYMVIPGYESERKNLLLALRRNTEFKHLDYDSISLGTEVLVKDKRRKPDAYPYKRGVVVRLPSSRGGTFCIFLTDFGFKLPMKSSEFFALPDEFKNKPDYIFRGTLMGLKPVSGFTFTRKLIPNSKSMLMDLCCLSNKRVTVQRLFHISDYIFCKVKSKYNNEMVDWTSRILERRLAIRYDINNGCFRPVKNYCYTYHMLNQCNDEGMCFRCHECPFCFSSSRKHRLNSCAKFLKAEQDFRFGIQTDSN